METIPARTRQERLADTMLRYARGDAAAFATVYQLAAPPLRHYLKRMTGDRALAEDLTHETFLRVHRFRGMYRADGAFIPWTFMIARRLYADHLRRRRLEDPREWAAGRTESQDPAPLADLLLDRKRLGQALDEAIAKLPSRQADVCRLVKDEGFTPAETGPRLGTSAGTARVRAHRAFRTLRERLTVEGLALGS